MITLPTAMMPLAGELASGDSEAAQRERAILEMQRQVESDAAAGRWEAAATAIARMAEIDREHPRVYQRILITHRSRGDLQAAPAAMDATGTGPGRLYGQALYLLFGARTEDAAGLLQQALAGYAASGHLAGQAAVSVALGNLHLRRGETTAAAAAFIAARPFLQRIQDQAGLTDLINRMGQLEYNAGHFPAALNLQRQALALRQQQDDTVAAGRSWYDIGATLHAMGETEGALEALSTSLRIRRQLRDIPTQTTTLMLMAGVQRQAGQVDAALESLASAMEITAGNADSALAAEVRRKFGETLILAGRRRQAVPVLAAAAGLLAGLGRAAEEAAVRASLCRTLTALGELEQARGEAESALALAQGEGATLEAAVLNDLGNVQFLAGELTAALLTQERALEMQRPAGDDEGEMASLNNLGAIHRALGEDELAMEKMRDSLALALRLQRPQAAARAHNNLGVLLADAARMGEAGAQFLAAERLWGELAGGDVASPGGGVTAGRSAVAALQGLAATRANAAAVLAALGHQAEAESGIEAALLTLRRGGDQAGEAAALNLKGEILMHAGKAAAAQAAHQQAFELATLTGLRDEEWRALAGQAVALERLGDTTAALHAMLGALHRVEQARSRLETDLFRMRFLIGKVPLYEHALTLQLGEAPDAAAAAAGFHLAERSRARSLLDLLAEARPSLRARLDPGFRRREDALLDTLGAATVRLADAGPGDHAAAMQTLQAAETELERFKLEARRQLPEYAGLIYPSPATLEMIEAVLEPGEALLEYVVGTRQAWLWVIQPGAVPRLLRLPEPAVLAARVKALRDALALGVGDLDGRAANAAAAQLAAVILPAELPLARRLLVAPDGPLHHVPFAALSHGGRFLAETHEIGIVPSASALHLLRSRRHAGGESGGFLGLGEPAGPGVEPLPFSRLEIEAIGSMFEPAARHLLTGPAATPKALKQMDLTPYRYLHFATHGWMDATSMQHTGLRLSTDGDDGGLLTVNDILSLELAADVVVLSACRSGLGELLRGEGLVSMTRAFLHAGAGAVLVSLWDVGDRSTADLMQAFYVALRHGETPAAALAAAQRAFITSDTPANRRLHVWAPFILVGEPAAGVSSKLNPGGDSPTIERR